jgi:hypothetical protein
MSTQCYSFKTGAASRRIINFAMTSHAITTLQTRHHLKDIDGDADAVTLLLLLLLLLMMMMMMMMMMIMMMTMMMIIHHDN